MVRETIPEEVSSSLKPVVDLELAKFGMSWLGRMLQIEEMAYAKSKRWKGEHEAVLELKVVLCE
jgi:hypothetical protein